MVVNGQVVIRPMMYLALSYDHRIVDGKEAVTFLVRVKEALEDPAAAGAGLYRLWHVRGTCRGEGAAQRYGYALDAPRCCDSLCRLRFAPCASRAVIRSLRDLRISFSGFCSDNRF
jgi:hypothetical protein